MTLQSPLTEFCKARGISGQLKSAFGAYIRSVYAEKFRLGESGETVHLILNRMAQDDLERAWQDFVNDLAKHLTQSSE